MFKQTEDEFRPCQLTQQHHQRRLKYSIKDDQSLNHCLCLNVCKIDDRNFLHVVDDATRYPFSRRLVLETVASIWNTFLQC